MVDLQHVVDAVTGIRGPDSSLLDQRWRVELVGRHLAQWRLFWVPLGNVGRHPS